MLHKKYFELLPEKDRGCSICYETAVSHEKCIFTKCCATLICKVCSIKLSKCPMCREVDFKEKEKPLKSEYTYCVNNGKCIAITTQGRQCKKNKMHGENLCSLHFMMKNEGRCVRVGNIQVDDLIEHIGTVNIS